MKNTLEPSLAAPAKSASDVVFGDTSVVVPAVVSRRYSFVGEPEPGTGLSKKILVPSSETALRAVPWSKSGSKPLNPPLPSVAPSSSTLPPPVAFTSCVCPLTLSRSYR